ncbi:hypothetical protein JCM11251_006134 [Rhodosporidiobolus azoricus]
MYRARGAGSGGSSQASKGYIDYTRRLPPDGYKPIPSSSGQPFSLPAPNGRSDQDRTMDFSSSPRRSLSYGGDRYGGVRGSSQWGNNGTERSRFSQPARPETSAWTNAARLNGNAGNVPRGGEGFRPTATTSQYLSQLADDDWRDDPGEKKDEAGSNEAEYRMRALNRPKHQPASASSSSFYGSATPADLSPDCPARAKERERANAVQDALKDAEKLARADKASASEAKHKAEALKRAREASAARSDTSKSKVLSVYDKLKAQSKRRDSLSASATSGKSSKDRSTSTRDRDEPLGKQDKGKGKASYLDEAADDAEPSQKRSSSSSAGGPSLKKLRKGGFDNDESRAPASGDASTSSKRRKTGEKESPKKKGKSRRSGSPGKPVVSLEDQFREAMEQEERSQPMLVSESETDGTESEEDDPLLRNAAYVDPDTLCPFCDNPLPPEPSADLLSLRDYLISRPEAESWPTADNEKHVRMDPKQRAGFCKRHRDETEVIPEGRAKGWPQEMDWEKVERRVKRDCADYLQKVIFGTVPSRFLDKAQTEAREKGKKLNDVKSDWTSFEIEQPGYYGHRGYVTLLRALTDLFTDDRPILTPLRTAPLPVDYYLRRVLIPECAISLIQQDMDLATRSEAAKVMQDSRQYGRAVFGDEDEEEREWAKREREGDMERERREREREREEREEESNTGGSGNSEDEVAALLSPKANKTKFVLDIDGATADEDAPPVSSKPTGRKLKALVEEEQKEQGSMKDKVRQRFDDSGEDDQPSPPKKRKEKQPAKAAYSKDTSASSTTSHSSSRTSKSTKITIPSSDAEESDLDAVVAISKAISSRKATSSASHSTSSKLKAKKATDKPTARDISALFAKQERKNASDRGLSSLPTSKSRPSASTKSKTLPKKDEKEKKKKRSLLQPGSSSSSSSSSSASASSSEDELLASFDNEISLSFRDKNRKRDKLEKERKKEAAKRKRARVELRKKGQEVSSSSDDE